MAGRVIALGRLVASASEADRQRARDAIFAALDAVGGAREAAASKLGVGRITLKRWQKRLGIEEAIAVRWPEALGFAAMTGERHQRAVDAAMIARNRNAGRGASPLVAGRLGDFRARAFAWLARKLRRCSVCGRLFARKDAGLPLKYGYKCPEHAAEAARRSAAKKKVGARAR